MFPGITRDMCFPGGGTHLTRDMCFPGRGTHITRVMCFPGGGTHITRDMCFPRGGTRITRDMCFPRGGTRITRDKLCVSQVGLTHGFGPKMAIFRNFFYLGYIGHENVFYDILERKNAFRGYENKTFKKSKN